MVKKSSKKIGVTPLGNRVLVRPLSQEELEGKTSSGIIIPETVDKEKPEQGEVVAIGEGEYNDGTLVKPQVKVGDRVMFSKYGYDEIEYEGEDYFIIKGSNILAVIE